MCFSGGWCSPRPTRAKPDVGPHPDSASRAGSAREPEQPMMDDHHWSLGIIFWRARHARQHGSEQVDRRHGADQGFVATST
jgi:hypothetical protein